MNSICGILCWVFSHEQVGAFVEACFDEANLGENRAFFSLCARCPDKSEVECPDARFISAPSVHPSKLGSTPLQ